MTISCKGQLIDLASPKVMGILNVTPDSFYAGSRSNSEKDILIRVEKMISDGSQKGLSEEFIVQFFKAIHQESIRHQVKVMNRE